MIKDFHSIAGDESRANCAAIDRAAIRPKRGRLQAPGSRNHPMHSTAQRSLEREVGFRASLRKYTDSDVSSGGCRLKYIRYRVWGTRVDTT